MKQTNSSGKNIAIFALGAAAVGGIIAYASPFIAKAISTIHSSIGYQVHARKMKVTTSSLQLIDAQQTNDTKQEAYQLDDQMAEQQTNAQTITISHIAINNERSSLNKFMEFFFNEKAALQFFLQKNAATLANSNIITTEPESAQQLETLMKNSSDVYNIDSRSAMIQELGKVVSLLANPKEHSQASLVKFLENIYNTATGSKVADILCKAKELKIFFAFVKILESLEEQNFKQAITNLAEQDFWDQDEVSGDKLTLFTKFMHNIDVIDKKTLDAICAILQHAKPEKITEFANDCSKADLANLLSIMQISTKPSLAPSFVKDQTNSFKTNKDKSQMLTLTHDATAYPTAWIGKQSEGINMIITSEKIEFKGPIFCTDSLLEHLKEQDGSSDDESSCSTTASAFGEYMAFSGASSGDSSDSEADCSNV